jgi:hypothetical protein
VEKIRFFVQAQNVLIITDYKGINPENGNLWSRFEWYPRAKFFQWVLTLTYNNYEKVYKTNNCGFIIFLHS